VWSAALGKILIIDNLRKRHFIVVDWCVMCKKNREFVDHLLYCEVACAIWNVFFKHFGLSWIMPRRIVYVFAYWKTASSSRNAAVWR
jgi:hypothetical protein